MKDSLAVPKVHVWNHSVEGVQQRLHFFPVVSAALYPMTQIMDLLNLIGRHRVLWKLVLQMKE
jgi:hypothetical protein